MPYDNGTIELGTVCDSICVSYIAEEMYVTIGSTGILVPITVRHIVELATTSNAHDTATASDPT